MEAKQIKNFWMSLIGEQPLHLVHRPRQLKAQTAGQSDGESAKCAI